VANPARRLLVVDDEPHIGLLLRLQMESRGYELRLARSLFEARAALLGDAERPDAVLLDLHLPDGSGVDLLLELRARPATATLPIIILTAEGEERVLQEARSLGAATVTKPFSHRNSRPRSPRCGRRAAGRPVSAWAVILAGGSGTRFWPLSTPERPKQLLPLAGDRPLLVQAVRRLDGLIPPDRVVILTGPFLVERVTALVPEVPAAQVLAEPRAASTAPALVGGAQWIARRDSRAQMLSLHADWAVGDERAFRQSAERALAAAREHDVLAPSGPASANQTGHGYIVPGKRDRHTRRVQRFREASTRRAAPPGSPGNTAVRPGSALSRRSCTRARLRAGCPRSPPATLPVSAAFAAPVTLRSRAVEAPRRGCRPSADDIGA
jgi:CheY-like chemotaxis protein